MAKKKRFSTSSVRLEDFPAEELEHLVLWYPYIRRGVERDEAMWNDDGAVRLERRVLVTIPKVNSAGEALSALRELEARGELWIRISTAGNLNVNVRVADRPGQDAGEHWYHSVIKQPSLARIEQRRRERPGEDPFARWWGFTLLPKSLLPDSRWEGSTALDTEAPEPERAKLMLCEVIAHELTEVDEQVIGRIGERAVAKLQRLIARDRLGAVADPDFDQRAGYQVARAVVDEIPNVDRAAAKRIADRVAARHIFEYFPDSL